MFGNILKMLFCYKFFTLSQPFSQLPNKLYIRKSTTTHTPAPTKNPQLSTQNPPPHNTETTKMPPPTPPQQQQKNQRSKRSSKAAREWSARKQIGERVIGDQADLRRSDPIQKGEGDQERERSAARTANSATELDSAISPLRLGLGRDLAAMSGVGPLLTLPTLSSFSLSAVLRIYESFSLSLSFSFCASVSSGSDLKVK